MATKIAKLCYDGKQYFACLVGQTPTVPAPSINAVFAANLRRRMEAAGLSQMALSKKCGVAQTSIGNYLDPGRRAASAKGKEPSAKLTEMAMIAEALDASPWEMLIPAAASQDAGVEQQAVEMGALLREMPSSARSTLMEQARLVHRATRPQREELEPAPSLGGESSNLGQVGRTGTHD